jgi:lipopolysaccharide export system protein LptA
MTTGSATLTGALLAALLLGAGPAWAQGAPSAPKPAPTTPPAGKAPAKTPAATPTAPGGSTGGSSAKGARSNAPIVIDADRMEASKKEGLVVFTGSVVAKQENSTQAADRMEVYLDDKGERVVRIVSTGNVKIVTEDCRTGTARRAEYYDDNQRLLLIGDAKVWQEENVVTGDEIEILLAEDRSTVRAGTQGRVKSVFYPKRDETQTDTSASAVKKDDKRATCGS